MQQQLGTPAIDGVIVSAHYEFGQGWMLTVATRRSGQLWTDGVRDVYEGLSTDQVVDVLDSLGDRL